MLKCIFTNKKNRSDERYNYWYPVGESNPCCRNENPESWPLDERSTFQIIGDPGWIRTIDSLLKRQVLFRWVTGPKFQSKAPSLSDNLAKLFFPFFMSIFFFVFLIFLIKNCTVWMNNEKYEWFKKMEMAEIINH